MIAMPFFIVDPENKISDFIEALTGLRPKEMDDATTFKLILGLKDPFEIGFIKAKHPEKNVSNLKYSMYVKMLSVICEKLKSINEFQLWVAYQNELKSLTNQN